MFRQEVIEAQLNAKFGKTLKIRPLKYLEYTVVLVMFTLIGALFLLFVEYSRKQTVHGILSPQEGVTIVRAPRTGTISTLDVKKGDLIKKGDIVLTLSNNTALISGQIASNAALEQLKLELRLLKQQLAYAKQIATDDLEQLKRDKETTRKKLAFTQIQREVIADKFNACNRMLSSLKNLLTKDIITEQEFLRERVQCLEVKSQLQDNEQVIVDATSALQSNNLSIESNQLKIKTSLNQLEQAIAAKNLDILDQAARSSTAIIAPIEGRIISVRSKVGNEATVGDILFIMAEDNYQLGAQLYIPTRAGAFIQPNQKVNIKFDAYPHQRYGWGSGTIQSISETTYTGNSVPNTIASNGYYYKVNVQLTNQYVNELNPNLPLINGMSIVAEIPYDTRYLWQWLFKTGGGDHDPITRFTAI